LSIAPGGSATTSLSVTSPTGAVDGNYSIGVSAQNGSSQSYTGSSSAAYAIVSALSVTASSGSATYTRTQKATVTAVVSAAGAPVAGGSVTFIMTKPDSQQVTQTVATDTNGKAVFLYSFNKLTDPKGTYQVGYIASFNGLYGKGKTSFLVKR
jgi:5-hydroxyisourate hydrolase-like protein (transthyretin family)